MTTPIKERPILMQGDMARATLANLKTMTRRTRGLDIVNEYPNEWDLHLLEERDGRMEATFTNLDGVSFAILPCPYGRVGDRLWVREAWSADCPEITYKADGATIFFDDSDPHFADLLRFYDTQRGEWRPSIHMPRWAARLHLEITSLAIERVQSINEADALREGVARFESPVKGVYHFRDYSKAGWDVPVHTARESFRTLICSINGDGIWTRNEWCWCIGFKVVSQ